MRPTPLHLASRNGHIKAVHLLLDHGANTEANKYALWGGICTPVVEAYVNHHYDIIRLLLKYGADIKKLKDSYDPLHYMVENNQMDLLILLLDHIDVDDKDIDGVTPLMLAAKLGRKDMIRVLLDRGADVNCTDNNGKDVNDHALARNVFAQLGYL